MEKNGYNMQKIITRISIIAIIASGLSLAGCSKEFARIEENQLQLQQIISSNTEQIYARQNELQSQVEALLARTSKIASDLDTLEQDNANLRSTIENNKYETADQLAYIELNQQQIRSEIEAVYDTGLQTAKNIAEIEKQRLSFADAQKQFNQAADEKMTAMENNQNQMRTSLKDIYDTELRMAGNVATIEKQQSSFADAQKQFNQAADEKMADMDENQKQMRAGIELIYGSELMTADYVSDLRKSNKKVEDTMVAMEENQKQIRAGLEVIYGMDLVIANNVSSLEKEYAVLSGTQQENNEQQTSKIAAIEQNMQQWQNRIENVQQELEEIYSGLNMLEQNIATLNQNFHDNFGSLMEAANTSNAKQLEFHKKTEDTLELLSNSISSIRENQTNLESMISYIQNNQMVIDSNEPTEYMELSAVSTGYSARQ